MKHILKSEIDSLIADGTREIARLENVGEGKSLTFDWIRTKQGATATTVQLFVQDSHDEENWDDVIATTAVALNAALGSQRYFISQLLATTAAQGSALSNLALAAGTVRNGPLRPFIRIVEKIAGTTGSPAATGYRVCLTVK